MTNYLHDQLNQLSAQKGILSDPLLRPDALATFRAWRNTDSGAIVSIMNLVSAFAIYFIIWWITLFSVLSFGLKTQDEAGEVVPGTTASAPQSGHMLKVFLLNTAVATALFASFYYCYVIRGLTFDDLPKLLPVQ